MRVSCVSTKCPSKWLKWINHTSFTGRQTSSRHSNVRLGKFTEIIFDWASSNCPFSSAHVAMFNLEMKTEIQS